MIPSKMTDDQLQIELMKITTAIKAGKPYDKARLKAISEELRKLGFPI